MMVALGVFFLAACKVSRPVPEQTTQQKTPAHLTERPLPPPTATPTRPAKLTPTPTAIRKGVFLTLWHGLEAPQALVLQEIVSDFQERHPGVRVNLRYHPYDDLYDQFVSNSEAGNGPALLIGPGEWGPRLYEQGRVADLSGFPTDGLLARIQPAGLQASKYQEALVGLPFSLRGIVMVRNSSIIPQAPQTFDQLVEVAKERNNQEVLGTYLDLGDDFAIPQISACGGNIMYPNGYPAFDDESGLCWLKLLQELSELRPVAYYSNQDLERFLAGKVGIILEGTWNLERMSDVLGDQLVIDPWPTYGAHRLSGFMWAQSVFMNSHLQESDQKAAWQFMTWLLSPAVQGQWARAGWIPARMDVPVENAHVAQVMDALEWGTAVPTHPDMDVYWEPLREALEVAYSQDGDLDAALQRAAEAILGEIRRLHQEY